MWTFEQIIKLFPALAKFPVKNWPILVIFVQLIAGGYLFVDNKRLQEVNQAQTKMLIEFKDETISTINGFYKRSQELNERIIKIREQQIEDQKQMFETMRAVRVIKKVHQ